MYSGEERVGLPFVGPAGKQLEAMIINDLGLSIEQVYLCNILKFKVHITCENLEFSRSLLLVSVRICVCRV